jgi:hypothetical protein
MSMARYTGVYVLWVLLLVAVSMTALVMLATVMLGLIAVFAPEQWPHDLETYSAAGGLSGSLPTATGYGRAVFCGKILAQGLMVALVLGSLIGIVRTVIRRAPFVRQNVTRLRVFAGVFGLVVILRLIGPLLFPFWYMLMLEAAPAPRLDPYALSMALLGLTLAEVFREGLSLRIDAEGTI